MNPSFFFHTTLRQAIRKLEREDKLISEERKLELKELAALLTQNFKENGSSKVVFICTHNSRRSQLAEIWFRTSINMYLPQNKALMFQSYSGGTSVTEVNYRVAAALERIGFMVERNGVGENPQFKISPIHLQSSKIWQERFGQVMFSKRYDNYTNPRSGYVGVLVCSDAEEACPIVQGAWRQIPIKYTDPKVFDGSDEELHEYDKKVSEIGREMLYLGRLMRKI